MSYGSMGTGLGAPVGGAITNFGNTTGARAPAATGSFDFGSTLNSNLLLDGLGKVLQGTGEMLQGASGGARSSVDGTLPRLGAGILDTPTTGTTGGLDGLTQSLGGGDLNAILGQLNTLVNQLQALVGQAPQQQQGQAQAPAQPQQLPQQQPQQPPVDPVTNLVNRANVDPQLRGAVTQVAQDPVGNKLLQGAVNGGLTGIQLANMPAGFFGQTLPEQKLVQIAPQTLQGNDLVRTVAHELTHAATLGNGDSLREENLADQIGTQIQQRLTGFGPGYTLGGDAYNGLPQDNGIVQALRNLGITV